MRLALLIALLFAPIAAHADPVTAAIAAFAAFATTTVGIITIASVVLSTGVAIYGSAQARRAERDAKNAANAAMQDRMATRIASDSAHRYIYGRAKVGVDIVAMFTSGDKDQFKHIVGVLGGHECDAVEEIYVNNVALGLLTTAGDVISGRYAATPGREVAQEPHVGPTFTLDRYPLSGSVLAFSGAGASMVEVGVTSVTGRSVTIAVSGAVTVSYQYSVGRRFSDDVDEAAPVAAIPFVRAQIHLGGASDAADAYLMSVVPDKWPATAVLRGLCYIVVTLDLNNPEFQNGQVPIQALVRGKQLYDPRSGLTQWSANPALAIYDYLTSILCGVPAADLPVAQFITAANVCDETSVAGGRYTINGTVTSDQHQASVLEAMAQCMAGGIVSTSWDIYAGKYIAPVATLVQSDIVGAISITPGVSDAAIYNGVKGQYLSDENGYVLTDFKPYQNDAYRAADGRDLYTNIDFPFTNTLQRVTNLARIFVEDQRNGFTINAEFSLKAWPLKVGQRIAFTSAFLGQSGKVYRITDKSYAPNSAVALTLKEDAASIWDFADAVTVDSTPNTDLPDPWAIAPLVSIACTSGDATLLIQTDGTIVPRILVTWPAATTQGVFTNGLIEIEFRAVSTDVWLKAGAAGDATSAYVWPVIPGWVYVVRARCVNPSVNTRSDWVYATHKAVGQSAPPLDVTGVGYAIESFGIRLSWAPVKAQSVAGYEIRVGGTDWASAGYVATVNASNYFLKPSPASSLTYRIKAIDVYGAVSINSANVTVTVPAPVATNATASVSGPDYVLAWSTVVNLFAIDHFELRYGASWAAGTALDQVKTIGYSQHVTWGGVRTFWIAAVDVAGNVGAACSVQITVANPAAASIAAQTIDNNVLLTWSDGTTTLPVLKYEIRRGASWAAGASIGDNGNGRFAGFFEQASGVYTYWVMATDTAGNASAPANITASVSQPPDYILRLDYTVDFAGLVYEFTTAGDPQGWTAAGATEVAADNTLTVTSTGTDPQILRAMNGFILYGCEYPTLQIRLRRLAGSGWDGKVYYDTAGHAYSGSYYAQTADAAPAIGEEKVVTFDLSSLTAGGSDWMASVINDIRIDLGTTSADIFEIDWIRLVPYTSTNVSRDGSTLYAALTTESWQSHFTSNGWTTPQDQITAGFPYFWEKSNVAGAYEEIVDYGAVLTSTAVTATMTCQTLSGAVTVTPKLSYKLNWADAWTDNPGIASIVASNFRFVKMRYDFSATGGANLLSITNINLKLSSKKRRDSGTGNAVSTDAGGTVINFNLPFVSASTPFIQPTGNQAVFAACDYVATVNPTSFKVLLFDKTGTRISGPFSWQCDGVF